MEPLDKIVLALAAGASASVRPNIRAQGRKITEDYQALKTLIQQKYGRQVNDEMIDLLKVGPGSDERQQAVAQQLQDAGVHEDEEIVQQAEAVLAKIRQHDPAALEAAQPEEEA